MVSNQIIVAQGNKFPINSPLGGEDENLDFEMGPNTSAYGSCSATLNGEMFVFGGSDGGQQKQVTFPLVKYSLLYFIKR